MIVRRPSSRARRLGVLTGAVALLLGGVTGLAGPVAFGSWTQAEPATAVVLEAARLDARLDELLTTAEPETAVSVWLGGEAGRAWYARGADVLRPSASAIKTAYLIELFAAYADRLDDPLPGIESFLSPAHPAVAHFDDVQRAEIRRDLMDASVREIGHHMIRGTRVSNVVYNAAANVTTAVLGGPAELTRRIHARDPAFDGLVVRRYMLADRNVTGDNEATARSLAAVLQRLARRDVPGVRPETVAAMRAILALDDQDGPGRHFFKSGSLDSDPLTRIASGFWEGRDRPIVYVVMGERPGPGALGRSEAGSRLQATVEAAADLLLEDARAAMR